MLWYYHGVLHPLQYSYTTLSQCGWPTLTVPVLLPSQCSIPPPLPSLSVETTSLPVQAHQSVISMCGVSLLSILLVVASLLTVLHLSQYLQVCSFWQHSKKILTLISITTSAPVGGIFNVSYTSDSLLVSLKVVFLIPAFVCNEMFCFPLT